MLKTIFKSKIIFTCILVCLLASIAVSGCGGAAPAATGGVLRYVSSTDGVSIGYPPKLARFASSTIAAPAVETLLRGVNNKLEPWLAESFKEDAATKTITLNLRKGVKFHDGTDFNAQAAKWNLDQNIAGKVTGTAQFKSVDVVDDYTVRINLTDWDNSLAVYLAQFAGLIVSPTAYKTNGEDWAMKNPVGTGPFQFVSWQKDVRTTYKKFDGYWIKGKPNLDQIEMTIIADPTTRTMSFKSKEADVLGNPDQKDITQFGKDGYTVLQFKDRTCNALLPSSAVTGSPWANLKVRQAAAYAINAEPIIKAILFGQAEPTNQWVSKGDAAYNTSVVGYPYNPSKAKQLLSEAGYPNGFKTKLTYRNITVSGQDIYAAVSANLKAVGIDAALDMVQSGLYDQIQRGGSWDGLLETAVSSIPDAPAAIASSFIGVGNRYTKMLTPDDYVKAVKDALTATNSGDKQKLTNEAVKLMYDKYCLQLPLYVRLQSSVAEPYMHDLGFDKMGPFNWSPEAAWMDKKK